MPNSEYAQRPLLIQTGKEGVESLQSLALFNDDIKSLNQDGVRLPTGQVCRVTIVANSLDRKAANLYLGLGGAYCDLCTVSKEESVKADKIEGGFFIDRNITDMKKIYDELVEEDGKIKKKVNDYSTRAGQTNKPIADVDVRSVQVLHGLLRGFDHFMKVVIHVSAGVLYWTVKV